MAAVVALFDLRAQCGGAARADVPEYSQLLGRQCVPPLVEKLLSVLTKDIGDF
jgi:hypothetical protein